MPKRGENIYRRKDGRWEGRVRKADRTGRMTGYRSVYGKTYREVKGKMEDLKRQSPSTSPCCGFNLEEAAEVWVREKKDYWKPTTLSVYCQILHKHVIPCLGRKRLAEVDERLLETFRDNLKNKKGNPLSEGYRRYICALILRIMFHIRKRYDHSLPVPALPAMRERQGRVFLPGNRVLSLLEVYLLQHGEDSACLGTATALYTGLRIGEICALKWEDINMEDRVIHVSRNMQRVKAPEGGKKRTEILFVNPKTADSVRQVPIPEPLYRLLEGCQRERTGFVLSGKKKAWMDPRTLQYRYGKILKECGIEYFNFHRLRHAFATRCVSLGFDVRSLSEILGHSSVRITLSLYVHPTLEQKRRMMDRFIPYSQEEQSCFA